MNKTIISLVFSLIIIFFGKTELSAQNKQSEKFNGGLWQTIVDGQAGEGSFFYRFDFKSDGTVEILKQFGGSDNLVEQKKWTQIDDKISIESNDKAKINEFDGTKISIQNSKNLIYKNNNYDGIINPHNKKLAIIHWLMIIVVLMLLNEIFRRNKWVIIAFFVALPIILTPTIWSQHDITYWFKWAKVYSVIFAVIWFTAIRFTKLGKHNWVKLIAALFLAVNIIEAVSQDFSMGFLPNTLNGIAGILNTITLFYGWKQIGPDNSKHKDMVWPAMTIFWIISYDIWNIVYVYLNFPGSTSAQLMVLLSCTIPALMIKKGTWLQARGFTLAAWFMYYFTVPRFTEQMELLVPRSYNLMLAVAIVSISANFIYFFVFLKNVKKNKLN